MTAAIGSTAWTSVPRICWGMGKDPDDDTGTRRVVNVSKSNFKVPEAGLSFVIDDDRENACGYVSQVATSLVDPDLLTAAPVSAEERSEQAEIADLLHEWTVSGPIVLDEARKALKSAGYDVSDRTVQRARVRAGLVLAPPGKFGAKRSFGRPGHFVPSGQPSVDTPSSSLVSTLCPHTTTREYMPSNASVDSSAEERSALSRLDDEQ